jgi:hypothetical protein
VFGQATIDVGSDAGVVSIIRAAHDIDAIFCVSHGQSSPPARSEEAGYFLKRCSGRIGRGSKLPPQFGHTPSSRASTQSRQKVHSNVQTMASAESGGRSLPQCSQFGRSCSIRFRRFHRPGYPRKLEMHPPRCYQDFRLCRPRSGRCRTFHQAHQQARAVLVLRHCPSTLLRE